MISQIITIKKDLGIHIRTAAEIVMVTERYKSRIFLHCQGDCQNCRYADACSIIQILSLGISQGDSVRITANGLDADKAIKDIHQILSDRD